MEPCNPELAPITIDPDAPRRRYLTKLGLEVPGVTTILDILSKPALVPWAAKLTREGRDWMKERDSAGRIGTYTHALVRCLLTGRCPAFTNEPDHGERHLASILAQRVVDWWNHEGLELVDSELPMVSDELRYGGTADLIAKDSFGQTVLLDLKTSSRIYPTHLLQVAAYSLLASEGYHPIHLVGVVLAPRAGKLAVQWMEGGKLSVAQAAFLHLVRFYHANDQFEHYERLDLGTWDPMHLGAGAPLGQDAKAGAPGVEGEGGHSLAAGQT